MTSDAGSPDPEETARIEETLAAEVRRTIAATLRNSSSAAADTAKAVRDLIAASMTMAETMGATQLATMRGIAKGVMQGVGDAGGDAVGAAREVTSAFVKEAAERGADVAAAARRSLDGVLDGVNTDSTAETLKSASAGVLESAREFSGLALNTMGEMFTALADATRKAAENLKAKEPPEGGTKV